MPQAIGANAGRVERSETDSELEWNMNEHHFDNMRPFIIALDITKENEEICIGVCTLNEHGKLSNEGESCYQVSIDEEEYIQLASGEFKHRFVPGKHRIKIRGKIVRIELGREHGYPYIDIEQWGDIQWLSMYQMFMNCDRINFSAMDAPDLSRCVCMSEMFRDAYGFNSPIGHWDVSHVEDMEGMFDGAKSFNQPIGDWDVSTVRNMKRMFCGATAFNQPISNWNTINAENMSYMFYHADSFNQPIGNWNTSKVRDMSYMFMYAASFNQSIGNWDTSHVSDMKAMFAAAYQFNQPIGDWNTENVMDMRSMFEYALSFDQPIGEWDTSHVTDMHAMFCGARSFNQDITEWNTYAVHDMDNMFIGASSFESEWYGYCLDDCCESIFRDNEILFDEPKRYNLPRHYEKSDHPNARVIFKELGLEGIFSGKDAIEMLLAHQIMQDKTDDHGISSGYAGLDELIYGFEKGTLTIIAGAQHIGKTALALNLVNNITLNEQIPAAYFSYDNSIVELTTKLLLIQTGLYERFSGCTLSFDKLENDIQVQLNRAMDTIAQSKIYFVDPLSPELEYLESQASVLRNEKGIQLLIVDYLQVLSIHGKHWHPDVQSSTVIPSLVIRLKRLARELDIPVIVLSQVNCLCMDRACRWPQKADLWGAGKCADNVLFINRPGYYDQYGGNKFIIHVDKSLHKTGCCELGWESMRCRLIEDLE